MALTKLPESWNDCDMNWENPDPYNPVYYAAIACAIHERCLVSYPYDAPSGNLNTMFLSILESLSIGNIMTNRTFMMYNKMMATHQSGFIDTTSFFNEAKVFYLPGYDEGSFSSVYSLYLFPDSCSDINATVSVLKSYKKLLDEYTLFAGSGYSSGSFYIDVYGGYESKKVWDSNLIKEVYDDVLEDCALDYNKNKEKILKDIYSKKNLPSAGLGRGRYRFSDYVDINVLYNSGWSNYIDCDKDFVVICHNGRTQQKPNVHIAMDILDTDRAPFPPWNDGGTFEAYDAGYGFFGRGVVKNIITGLTPQKTEIYTTPKKLEDYPVQVIPNTRYRDYRGSWIYDITFAFDFNCEGGFKFRPDDK